uniref:Uncharacterized protein n=1 Tax=Lepeophtheirus salmonis TaxID=72036 RepID=A0A0K2V046_LEPSM
MYTKQIIWLPSEKERDMGVICKKVGKVAFRHETRYF